MLPRIFWLWLGHSAIFGIFCARSPTAGGKRDPHRRTQISPRFKSAGGCASVMAGSRPPDLPIVASASGTCSLRLRAVLNVSPSPSFAAVVASHFPARLRAATSSSESVSRLERSGMVFCCTSFCSRSSHPCARARVPCFDLLEHSQRRPQLLHDRRKSPQNCLDRGVEPPERRDQFLAAGRASSHRGNKSAPHNSRQA